MLNNSHIDYIEKDLLERGLVYDPLKDEILDHVCESVESRMTDGKRFIEAYQEVLEDFGSNIQLQELQSSTIQFENFNNRIMIRNYFKIALRNLAKSKFYSLINITGLAVGIACCLLIVLYVTHELSFDKHWQDSEHLYRVSANHQMNGQEFKAAVTPAPLAQALISDYPEVVAVARFRNWGSGIFKLGTESFKEEHIAYADSTIFDVFSFEFIEGDPTSALKEPNSIVLSESSAKKYFGNSSALNKSIQDESNTEYNITGVYRNLPSNTHFDFDLLISMAGFGRANNDNWLSNNFYTYFKLQDGNTGETLEPKLIGMVEKYMGPQVEAMLGVTLEQAAEQDTRAAYVVEKVEDIYLKSEMGVEIGPTSDMKYTYIFTSIAVFILVIACINFMNLSTARSASRAKEVGVRKVLGSYRSHLIKQFLSESVLLAFGAFVIAVGLAYVALPGFNVLSGKYLQLPLDQPVYILAGITIILFVGLAAGVYPAFVLSSFKPVNVLKGVFKPGNSNGWFRSVLVVFQFCISILLIVGTLAITKQLRYVQNKNLGFAKEQVLLVHDTYLLGNQANSYRNNLSSHSNIQSVSTSGFLPVDSWRSDNTFFPEGSFELEKGVNMQNWGVDHRYLETMQMKILKGRSFDEGNEADQFAMLLNETAAEKFGFEEPVGARINSLYWDPSTGSIDPDSIISYTVIGVIEDFHFSSLKRDIGPLCMRLDDAPGFTAIRFKSENIEEIIEIAENEWNAIDPAQPFEYSFMDQRFSDMYKAETRTGEIFTIFAGLAIFVACLGLFALAAFTAEQRTKEISVRKVMGASVPSIVILLSREFGKLIAISFVIAIPFAIYGVNSWLTTFAYKVDPGIETFALAGLVAMLVAFITVSYQSIKAAMANPATTLRSE